MMIELEIHIQIYTYTWRGRELISDSYTPTGNLFLFGADLTDHGDGENFFENSLIFLKNPKRNFIGTQK